MQTPLPPTLKKSRYGFLVQTVEKRSEMNEKWNQKFPDFVFLAIIDFVHTFQLFLTDNCATAEAVAAPKTKRDRVAELHYITRGAARNVEDPNFKVS